MTEAVLDMSTAGQFPLSTNIIFEQGKAFPSWDHGAMTNSADISHYFLHDVLETQNPAGNPRNYAFGNNKAFYEEDGIRTTDQTFSTNCVVQGAVICEGPPITPASGAISATGVKKLLVTFGDVPGGLAETTRIRTLTTDTSPWTAAVATTTATAATMFGVIPVGPDLIAATGSLATGTNLGRTALGEYRIAKCPAGSDPTLAASWVNIVPVGTPEWPINALAPLFDSYVVGKGDGAYYWNDRVKRHVNALSRLRYRPHALNCKGMTAGENCVWIPMADGRVFRFDGVSAREETPTKGIVVPRDFYASRITAIVDDGDTVAMRSEPNYNSVTGPRAASALGMKVITYINSVATDVTSQVTNGVLTDGMALAGYGTLIADSIYIGLDQPFEAVTFRVTRNPNTNSIKFAAPRYSNGTTDGTLPFATAFPIGTAFTSIRDGTVLGNAAISCALTGYPPGASEAIISWPNVNAYDLMQLTTLQFGGSIGDQTKYWIRLIPSASGTGMTNPTTVDEVDVVPSRGGLPNSGLLSTTTNYSHRLNSNSIGLVYWAKNVGGKYSWQTPYAIDDGGGVWAMSRSVTRTGTMTNGGSPMLLWGRYQQTIIALGVNNNPGQQPYPKLVQGGAGKPFPAIKGRKLLFGNPWLKTRIKKVTAVGQYITQADQLGFYCWWDNEDEAFDLDESFGAPWVFEPTALFPTGREFNFELLFLDGDQSDPTAPYIEKIIIDWEDEPEGKELTKDVPFPATGRELL